MGSASNQTRVKNPASGDNLVFDEVSSGDWKRTTADDIRRWAGNFAVASMQDLLSEDLNRYSDGDSVYVRNFYPDVQGGGDPFNWDATGEKGDHDGITIVDPTHSTTPGNAGWWTSENTGTTGVFRRREKGYIATEDAGFTGSGSTEDGVATQAILSNYDNIVFSDGEYPPITISESDKTIMFSEGALVRTPDGEVTSSDTSPSVTLNISGNNNDFYGIIVVDGNSANNDSSNISNSDRRGVLNVSGDNNNFHNGIRIKDSYWVGFSAGAGTGTPSAATNLFIDKIIVDDATSFPVVFWNCQSWQVNNIITRLSTQGSNNRIRTGAESSSSFFCDDGYIGSINGDTITTVIEQKTRNLSIGSFNGVSIKVEGAENVEIDSINSYSLNYNAYSFAIIDSERVNIGAVTASNHSGNTTAAISLNGVVESNIDSIIVKDSASSEDIDIRSHDGLTIGSMLLNGDGVNTDYGLYYDYDAAYSPQDKLIIGSIISRNHATQDVELQNYSNQDVQIGFINPDATSNIAYIKRQREYEEGTVTVTMTASTSGTITLSDDTLSYTKVGRIVTIQGLLEIGSVSSPTGDIKIEGLPFASTGLAGQSGISVCDVYYNNLSASSGNIKARLLESSSILDVYELNGDSVSNIDSKLQSGSQFVINMSYISE